MEELVEGTLWAYVEDVRCEFCGHLTVWSNPMCGGTLCVNCGDARRLPRHLGTTRVRDVIRQRQVERSRQQLHRRWGAPG